MSKLKHFRLLCFLLSFLLLFGSSSLNVSAASDSSNMLDTDLNNWHISEHITFNSYNNDIYRIYFEGFGLSSGDDTNYFSGIRVNSSLVPGHNYTVSLKFPDASEINKALGTSLTDSQIISSLNNDNITVVFGIGFYTNKHWKMHSNMIFKCSGTEFISNYYDSTVAFDFTYESVITGDPYFNIGFITKSDYSDYALIYISNPVLSDNTTAESDSLLSRLFSFISEKFGTWFGSLSSGISDLGDSFSTFISGLGDRISGFFDKLKSDMTSGFTNVGTWFTNLGNNLSSWFDGVKLKFQEVGDSIKLKFQEIADSFTAFFDKFKPRVYISFNWTKGSINWTTGDVNLNPSDGRFRIFTDFFTIPANSIYYLDFVNGYCDDITIFQYDLNGKFIKYILSTSKPFEEYLLPSGYQYRFMVRMSSAGLSPDLVNDYVLVYADEGWINAFFYNIKMGIRNLFVPDEAAILQLKTDLDIELQNHLGIIYTSSNLVINFITTVFDIVTKAPSTFSLTVPEVSLNLSGTSFTLWDDTNIDFTFMKQEPFVTIYNFYKIALFIFFGVLEVKYAMRVYRRMMAN